MARIYTARFHLIEPDVRLIYAFDMRVGGTLFSVSLAGVEFKSQSGATELTYTEQGLFLIGEYNAESRAAGTSRSLEAVFVLRGIDEVGARDGVLS